MPSSRIKRTAPALVAGALLAASLYAAPAGVVSTSDQVRSLNGEALRLESEARHAKSPDAQARAAQSLARRQKALQALIDRDPANAAAIALPSKVLQQLAQTFPAQKPSLEQRGSWDGEVEYLIEDDLRLAGHRKIFKLHRGAETLDLNFAGREPPQIRSGQKLRVSGVRSALKVAATDAELLDAFVGGNAGSMVQDANAGAQCSTTGPQAILTVLVNLPSYKLPTTVTPDFMRGVLLGNAASSSTSSPDWNLNDFWQQSSDGRTWVDAGSTVVGPILLSSDFNKSSNGTSLCDNYGLRDEVMAAIDGQVDFRNYSRIQIVMPNNGACSWSGTANVGCRSLSTPGDGTFQASVAWQRADQMANRKAAVMLSSHELGHNLNLAHANSRAFGSEALGPVDAYGTVTEYGDIFSTMGTWNLGFYDAPQAANVLGWLTSGTNYQTVESGGTYTIQNYEARPAGVKALKVRRAAGVDAWLWIESRQAVGSYDSQLNSSVFSGALIHYQDSYTSNDSHLLDFNPATPGNFSDAALALNRTWTDPYGNLNITVTGVSPAGLTVAVNYGAPSCTTADPTVTLLPVATSAEQGKGTQISVTVRNNNSSACAAEAFSLTPTVASGLSGALGSASLLVSPGQQAQTTLNVSVPAGFALGTYAVSVSAKGSTSGASSAGGANVTVTEPASASCSSVAPTLLITPTDLGVTPGGSGQFSISVTSNSSQACGNETYSLEAMLPAGWTSALSAATVTVGPGVSSAITANIGVPAAASLATYPVSFSLRDGGGALRTSAAAAVHVSGSPPPPPCTLADPTVTMSPGQATIEQGGAMQLSVTIRNNSSAACAAESIQLGSIVPKGWSDAFGGNTISLAPGEQAHVALSVAVPSSFDTGIYPVVATAKSTTSGMSGEAAANISVTKPAPPPCTPGTPTLSLSPSSASVVAGSTIQVTISAGNTNSATCETETFGIGASVPTGWSQSLGSTALTIASGGQGTTTLTVQVPSSQEAGTFQVGAGLAGAKSGLRSTQVVNVTVESPAPTPEPTPSPTPTPEPTPTPVPTPNPAPTPVSNPSSEKPVTSTGQTVQLWVLVSNKNKGMVAVAEAGGTCTKKCSYGFAQSSATTVTLTAVPRGRYVFTGWGGACAASGTATTCTVTMDAAQTVTASFVKAKK